MWKKHRKFLKHALNPIAVKRDYSVLQERKAYQYCLSLMEKPAEFLEAIKRLDDTAMLLLMSLPICMML